MNKQTATSPRLRAMLVPQSDKHSFATIDFNQFSEAALLRLQQTFLKAYPAVRDMHKSFNWKQATHTSRTGVLI
jgi:hypothetical protein